MKVTFVIYFNLMAFSIYNWAFELTIKYFAY